MLRFARHVVLALLVAAHAAPAWGSSDSRVGNGGSLFYDHIEDTREILVQILEDIVSRKTRDSEVPLLREELAVHCKELISGSISADPNEDPFCVRFILGTAKAILDCNRNRPQAPRTVLYPEYPESLNEADYVVDYPGIPTKRVDARTEPGCSPPVYFHYERLRDANLRDLFRITAHEFGHKVPFDGVFQDRESDHFIGDTDLIDDSEFGVDFLKRFGGALWLYGSARGITPAQPTVVSEKVDIFECEATWGPHRAAFQFLNTRLNVGGPNDFLSLNYLFEAGGFDLEPHLREWPKLDAQLRINLEINERGGCDDRNAGDRSDFYLMKALPGGRFKRIPGTDPISENILCEPSQPISISYKPAQEPDVEVTCRYRGYHRR